jgi:NAD(P)-dependent dehydrogenase (short-subunit alcohol dehydrogenase family)
MHSFEGQVVVVTGAGSENGIGRAQAILLASLGAKVVVNDFGVGPAGIGAPQTSGAAKTVQMINDAGGEAVVDGHSVAERDQAKQIIQTALDAWGRVDAVINNAGATPSGSFADLSDDQIKVTIDTHVWGHIWVARAVWPVMQAQKYGRIVNVASNVPLGGVPGLPVYSMAKMGVMGLTRGLAAEAPPYGIRVNTLCPVADTLMLRLAAPLALADKYRTDGVVAENVAPVAAMLAHRDVPFNGKAIIARGGAAREVLFGQTRGSEMDASLHWDALWQRLPQALDRADLELFADPGAIKPG